MPAFISSPLISVTTRRHSGLQCRPRSPRTSRRVVRAVISRGPRAEPTEDIVGEVEPFNWVENWYPIVPEKDAPGDEPYSFTLFDAPYVLFHQAPGRWAVLDDRCSHRLAPLSEGRLVPSSDGGDVEIECAYHGWGFNGCGGCTRVPQLEQGAKIPRRADVRSYRTVVDVGMIWMYLGDASNAPPLPPVPKEGRVAEEAGRTNFLSTFMYVVPYGYETLVENMLDPEHTHFAHHNMDGNRANGGKTVLTAESVPGTHNMKFGRQLKDKSMPGGFIPPCISYVKRSNLLLFLAAPSKRGESRIFVSFTVSLPTQNPLVRLLVSAVPVWYFHLNAMNVIDSDSILLRGLQRNLGDPVNWKSDFVLLENTCDKYLAPFRRWMDKYRDSMPWKSLNLPIPALTRDAMLDRFNLHVVHCKSCMGAYKGFERATTVADVVSMLSSVALICVVIVSSTGNPEMLGQGVMTLSKKIGALLFTLILASVLMRIFFAKMKSEFVLTDTARKIYLKE